MKSALSEGVIKLSRPWIHRIKVHFSKQGDAAGADLWKTTDVEDLLNAEAVL